MSTRARARAHRARRADGQSATVRAPPAPLCGPATYYNPLGTLYSRVTEPICLKIIIPPNYNTNLLYLYIAINYEETSLI